MSELRRRTAELLEAHRPDDTLGHSIDIFLILLILGNVVAIILETVPGLDHRYEGFFRGFEIFSIAVFSVEYLARLWSCVEKPLDDDVSPRLSRSRWVVSPLGLVDLVAILPFYLFLLLPASPESLLMLRVFRALRLLRIFKLARYSPAMGVLLSVIRKEAPVLLVAASVLFMVLMVSSWAMFLLEREAQPETFGTIPDAMWWAVVTLTTVGYGDVFPVTNGGKLFAGIIALVGIGMMALPAAILASGFYSEVRHRSQTYKRAVELALSNGTLSEHEAQQLEVLREELGLSEEEALEKYMQARHRRLIQEKCPKCGEEL